MSGGDRHDLSPHGLDTSSARWARMGGGPYTTSYFDHIRLPPCPVCEAFSPQQTGSEHHHERQSIIHGANPALFAHTHNEMRLQAQAAHKR